MSQEDHWNRVYSTKSITEVSWFEKEPQPSLNLIQKALPDGGEVIDIGGGASCLVDQLLATGKYEVAVLDLSRIAINLSKTRLRTAAERVRWIICNVTQADDIGEFDLWHDRAVFHFLTAAEDRRAYAELAAKTIRQGGFLIIATFAIDGPMQCSGLDTCQYDLATLSAEFSLDFHAIRNVEHLHVTPSGKQQPFLYMVFQRITED